MTEEQWLACDTPESLLRFVRGKLSDRKLRLFVAGCCRNLELEIPDQSSWDAVHVAEWCADGHGTERDLEEARREADASAGLGCPAAVWATASDPWEGAVGVVYGVYPNTPGHPPRYQDDDAWEERRVQSAILRDIVGPLLFRPVAADPAWLSWNDDTVPKLARAIYDDYTFDRLPILADALEEAGCTDADILDHCRQPGKPVRGRWCPQPGEHVRGCWVVDLLLGKK